MTEQQIYDVFICYNARDRDGVRAIKQALDGHGLRVFFDDDEIAPGETWQEVLQKALAKCRSVAVCLGPHGLGPTQIEEARAALNASTGQGGKLLVYLVELPGGDVKTLQRTDFLHQRSSISIKRIDVADASFQEAIWKMEWSARGYKPSRPKPVAAAPAKTTAQPTAVLEADIMGSLASRFASAVNAKGIVLALGRGWMGENPETPLLDETRALGRELLMRLRAENETNPPDRMMPSLDEMASCLSAVKGHHYLSQRVRHVLHSNAYARPMEPEMNCLIDFARAVLKRQTDGFEFENHDCPVILTTGLGLTLETLLLHAGIPFVRVAPCRLDDPLAWVQVSDCTKPEFLAMAKTSLPPPFTEDSAQKVARLVRAIGVEFQDTSNSLSSHSLPKRDQRYWVLVKWLGSSDITNSCVVTRSGVINCVRRSGQSGLGDFVQTALAKMPLLMAGCQPLDPDFELLMRLALRPAFGKKHSQNLWIMLQGRPDFNGRERYGHSFAVDWLQYQWAAQLHQGMTDLSFSTLAVGLTEFLKRLMSLTEEST